MTDGTGSGGWSYSYDRYDELQTATNAPARPSATPTTKTATPPASPTRSPAPAGPAPAPPPAPTPSPTATTPPTELHSITDFNSNTTTIEPTPRRAPQRHLAPAATRSPPPTTTTDLPQEINARRQQRLARSTSATATPHRRRRKRNRHAQTAGPSPQLRLRRPRPGHKMTPGRRPTGYDASGNLTTLPNGDDGNYDNASELIAQARAAPSPPTATTTTGSGSEHPRNRSSPGTLLTSATYNGAQELTAYSIPAASMTPADLRRRRPPRHPPAPPSAAQPPTKPSSGIPTAALPRLLMDSHQRLHLRPRNHAPRTGQPLQRHDHATSSPTRSAPSARTLDASGAVTAHHHLRRLGQPQPPGGLTATPPSATPAPTPTPPGSSTSSTATTTPTPDSSSPSTPSSTKPTPPTATPATTPSTQQTQPAYPASGTHGAPPRVTAQAPTTQLTESRATSSTAPTRPSTTAERSSKPARTSPLTPTPPSTPPPKPPPPTPGTTANKSLHKREFAAGLATDGIAVPELESAYLEAQGTSEAANLLVDVIESDTEVAASIADEAGTPEVYYRTMSDEHFAALNSTGRLQATSETFISPSEEFSAGFRGRTVEFSVRPGTTDALAEMGVRDTSSITTAAYPDMPLVSRGWNTTSAFFKGERGVINIGLGRGPALDTFNDAILGFREVSG